MEDLNQFAAELEVELTEENIVSDCFVCGGSGIKTVSDEFGVHAEECGCLQKFHDMY